jgi:hypothetical protein
MKGFLWSFICTICTVVGATWIWAIFGPMFFLDPEFPMWVAKKEMLNQCHGNETVILGDSRAMADLIPKKIDASVVNLAIGGAGPIEMYYASRQLLDSCTVAPRKVVISVAPFHFVYAENYWGRTALFHFLSYKEMSEVRRTSEAFGDGTVYSTVAVFGSVENMAKDWLYTSSFPSLYIGGMLQGRFVFREGSNRSVLEAIRAERGYHAFGDADGFSGIGAEAYLQGFAPSRLLNTYFDRLIRLYGDAGLTLEFMTMPLNEASYRVLPDHFREEFSEYLEAYHQRYPWFVVRGDPLPCLPSTVFGDAFHLNRRGAEWWSEKVASSIIMDGSKLDYQNSQGTTRQEECRYE